MSKPAKLPNSILALVLLVGFGAAVNFLLGIWLIANPENTGSGTSESLPNWYVLFGGLACLILALVYVWIISQILKRAESTQTLIQVVSVINISFAIFRMPFGLVAITVNVLAIAISSSSAAKSWFLQDN